MTRRWPFLRPSYLLGIGLEPAEVVVCGLRRRGSQIKIESSLRIPIPAQMFKTDPVAAGQALHAQLQAARVPPGRCVVCIPLSWGFSTQLELPDLSEADVQNLIRLEAERRFPLAPDDLVLTLSRRRAGNGADRALLLGVPAEFLSNVASALGTARLRPVSLTMGIAALAAEHPDACITLLHLGKGFADLAILDPGYPPLLRNLAWLENSASNSDAATWQDTERHLRITLAQLPAERRSLMTTAMVYANAGDVMLDFDAEESRRAAAPELSMAFPDFAIEEGTLRAFPNTAQDAPAVLAATAGALLGVEPEFELIPPKRKAHVRSFAARLSGRSARWAVGLVTGAILFLVGAFVFQAQQLNDLEDRWSAIAPRVQQARIVQDRVKKYRSWYDDETIPSLALLKYVATAFPDEGSVWLKSIRIKDRTAATCSGNATNRAEWMQVMEKLGANKDIEDLQIVQARGDEPFTFTLTFDWKRKEAGGL